MSVVPLKSLYNHLLAEVSVTLSRFGVECISPMPTFLSVEPSAVCQLHCPECPCGNASVHRKNPYMSMDIFHRIVDECHSWVHTIQFYLQGEPLLNPNLPEMIHLAHQRHIYTTCSTNAQAVTPLLAERLMQSGLDRIIVSIDGLSEESYGAYRQGGSLNRALQGLICLREAKQKVGAGTHIELQCLRLRTNEHEWALFQRSYRQMGADSLTLKSAQFYDYQFGNPFMPSDEQYARYCRTLDGIYHPKNRLSAMKNRPCRRILTGCVITVNGDVLPCCFDKKGLFPMGNIQHASLHNIWHSAAFHNFRHRVRLDRMKFAMCGNCTED